MISVHSAVMLVALIAALTWGTAQAQGPCIEGVRCNANSISYTRFTTAACTDTAVKVSLACPTATPQCFGGNIGAAAATGTAAQTDLEYPGISAGPCVARPACRATGSYHLILNNRRDCRYYYTCSPDPTSTGFFITTGGCPNQDEFNNSTQRCEPAATANCSIPLATTPATSSPTVATSLSSSPSSSSITSSGTTTVTPSTPATTPSAPRPTPPACQGFGRLADPTSCRHFYICGFFGRQTRRRCPFSRRFDTNAGKCSQGADCGSRPLV